MQVGTLCFFLFLLFVSVAPAAEHALRRWTDRSGRFSVEATLVTFKGGKVYLEKPDGSTLAVPIEKLSFADYDYLRSLKRTNNEIREFFYKNTLPTQHTVFHMPSLQSRVNSLDFSPNSRFLAATTDVGIIIVDMARWATVPQKPGEKKYVYFRLCRFTPDGTELVVTSLSNWITTFRISEKGVLSEIARVEGPGNEIMCMAFSPDGQHVLTGHRRDAYYWHLASGKVVHRLSRDSSHPCKSCFVNPKGTQGLVCDGKFVTLYDLQAGRPIQQMQVSNLGVYPAAISPDGTRVAVVTNSSSLVMWKTLEGTASPPIKRSRLIDSLQFSRDGRYLLVGNIERVELLDAHQLRPLETFFTSGEVSTAVTAIAPDNRHFAVCSGSLNRNLQIFRIPNSTH